MTLQSLESPNRDNFGTSPWDLETKNHSDVGAMERRREYYMREGGGLPRIRVVVSFVSPKLPMVCPSTKGALESELTNLLVSLMQVRINN